MNTTVITTDPADYGAGSSDRITFVESSYTVDEDGRLHVFRKPEGNVGSFPAGAWRAVLRGNPVAASGLTEVSA